MFQTLKKPDKVQNTFKAEIRYVHVQEVQNSYAIH